MSLESFLQLPVKPPDCKSNGLLRLEHCEGTADKMLRIFISGRTTPPTTIDFFEATGDYVESEICKKCKVAPGIWTMTATWHDKDTHTNKRTEDLRFCPKASSQAIKWIVLLTNKENCSQSFTQSDHSRAGRAVRLTAGTSQTSVKPLAISQTIFHRGLLFYINYFWKLLTAFFFFTVKSQELTWP